MSDYKVNFREMKSRVGIDDIAYALGYRLDRKAGVGRYIELVLGEGGNRRDTLIVSHPNDKAAQTFFRRDGSKGDVVTLIRENLSSFTVSGKDEWQKIAKVMARFANMPEPEYREYVKSAGKSSGMFDASRYEVKPIDTGKIPGLFFRRGLSKATVTALLPFISLIRDRNNGKFEGYNIGFPYTDGKGNEVRGYEIRGHGGYKSKAAGAGQVVADLQGVYKAKPAGTDSSSSAWVAVPSGISPDNVRSVFFCESAFDAMAFYQMNRIQIGESAALVSLGGTFSDRQITGVMERFPNARAFDCFDNDLAGRIYGLRMMALQEDIQMKISRTDGGIRIEVKGKVFDPDMERPLLAQVARQLNIRYRMGQWLPPKAFKDWNDCLLNRPMEPVISPHKEEREQNLSEQRNKGRKI